MNIMPFGDRVLVLKDAIADKTEGGIIIKPESDDGMTRTGIVQEAAPIKELLLMKKKRVLFNKYAGVSLKNDLVLLKQEEILAVIE